MLADGMAQIYNTPASAREGATYVRYTGTVDMTADADSVGNHYTKALFIGNSNRDYGALTLHIPDVPGTEKISVYADFSNDLTTWKSIGTAVITDAGNGISLDSLHVVDADTLFEFQSLLWLRLHFDGETGNPANVITWDVFMPKPKGAPASNTAFVENSKS